MTDHPLTSLGRNAVIPIILVIVILILAIAPVLALLVTALDSGPGPLV